jgi:transposase
MTDACPAQPRSPVGVAEEGWRIPDVLWERLEPLLPPRTPHPFGCHNPRVPDRRARDALCFGLRTGGQWGALEATGLCAHSAAHRRFQAWVEAGGFLALWQAGVLEYDRLKGLEWSWRRRDGCQTKAPLGGEKHGEKSHRPGPARCQAQPADGSRRRASGPRHRGRQPPRHAARHADD